MYSNKYLWLPNNTLVREDEVHTLSYAKQQGLNLTRLHGAEPFVPSPHDFLISAQASIFSKGDKRSFWTL